MSSPCDSAFAPVEKDLPVLDLTCTENTHLNPLEWAFILDQQEARLKKQLKELEAKKREVLENCKATGCKESNGYVLKVIPVHTQRVNPAIFFRDYPDEFFRLAKIGTTDARNAIGKEHMKDVCDETVTERLAVAYEGKGTPHA